MPDVDKEDTRSDLQTSRLVSNGKEVSVRLELGYPAQLVGSDPRDNSTITICDTSLCVGDFYNLVLEFDTSPQPRDVEWTVRSNDRRGQVRLREGERTGDYEAGRVSVESSRNPDRYTASLAFNRVQQEDADYRTEHSLRVTNRAGVSEFLVKFDRGRRCECDRNNFGGEASVRPSHNLKINF